MSKTLAGRRILVTRPAAQAGKLAGLIAARGGEAVLFPLLEIGPAADLQPLAAAAERLEDYAIAVFISPNAVEYSLPALLAGRAWPRGVQAAAIGQSTAADLVRRGVENVIAPVGRFDSEALLELPAFQADCVADKRVLILRGNGGRELLADTLQARGASVDGVCCYLRSAPEDASVLVSSLHNNRLDALTISSSEGLRNLWGLLDTDDRQRLSCLPIFVPHSRIAEQAAELGLQEIVLTAPADAGIMESLTSFDWLRNERQT